MDMNLLSFSDDLNLEDKKLRLKQIHEMNNLQVCRLDTIQIRSSDRTPEITVNNSASNRTICHNIRYAHISSAPITFVHESKSDESVDRLYDNSNSISGDSIVQEENIPIKECVMTKAMDQISIAPVLPIEPRVLNYQHSKHSKSTCKRQYTPSEISTQTSRTLIELLQEEHDMQSLSQSRSSVMKRSQSIISMRSTETGQEDENDPWEHTTLHQPYIEQSSNSKRNRRGRRIVSPNFTTRNRTGTPHKLIITPRKIVIRQQPKNEININSEMLSRSLRHTGLPNRNCNPVHECPSNTSSVNSERVTLTSVIDKIYNFSWEIILSGMNELLYIAPNVNWPLHEREICLIYRKLLECFRSPRSSVGRVACQVSGEMFRITKCSRRPEYDELVDMLLNKTADTNRFIQRDSNVALDKMVASLPMFHVVRVICNRGPTHKNPLVRSTVARLLICTCALNGNDSILGVNANAHTRKRVLLSLSKFLLDKNQDTRKYGERLCNILQKHRYFQEYFFKDMEPNTKFALRKVIKSVNYKVF